MAESVERKIIHASLALIRSVLSTEKGIRLVGVTVSNFDRAAIPSKAMPRFTETALEMAI